MIHGNQSFQHDKRDRRLASFGMAARLGGQQASKRVAVGAVLRCCDNVGNDHPDTGPWSSIFPAIRSWAHSAITHRSSDYECQCAELSSATLVGSRNDLLHTSSGSGSNASTEQRHCRCSRYCNWWSPSRSCASCCGRAPRPLYRSRRNGVRFEVKRHICPERGRNSWSTGAVSWGVEFSGYSLRGNCEWDASAHGDQRPAHDGSRSGPRSRGELIWAQ